NAVSASVLTLTKEVSRAMMMSKLKAAAGLVVLVAALGLGAGAVAWQSAATTRGATPAEPGPDGKGPPAPRKAGAKPPAYVIEPPDALLLEHAPQDGGAPVRITGQRLVRPDGTIGLGQLGSVAVAGRTPEEARDAVAAHLARRLDGFDPGRLTLQVVTKNSKCFYVIAGAADGAEEVYRF